MKRWTDEETKNFELILSKNDTSFDNISKIFNTTKGVCIGKARKMGLKSKYVYKLHSHNENFWSIPNPINSYWAGFSAADCCLGKRGKGVGTFYHLSLASLDRNHLLQLKKDCEHSGPLGDGLARKIYPYSSLIISSCPKWIEDLKNNFNVIQNKTYRLGPPNLQDDYLKLCYLVGYIDGDGCVCLSYRKQMKKWDLLFSFTSASEDILWWVKLQFDTFFPKESHIQESNVRKHKKFNYCNYQSRGMRPLLIYDFLRRFPVPKLDRKWNRPEVNAFLEEQKLKYPEYFKYRPVLNTKYDMSFLNIEPVKLDSLQKEEYQPPVSLPFV